MVAAGEIGAAYAAGEQHVADESAPSLRAVEHHMAGGVAWAVAHIQRAVADHDLVAVGQPTRRLEGLGRREAEHLCLLGQSVDPELVARMRADDRQPELARQRPGAAGMVDVCMR